jgi:hypothetical protein
MQSFQNCPNIVNGTVVLLLAKLLDYYWKAWLGATSGERASNFLFLIRFIPASVETLLFVWLIISLVRRSS